MNWFLKLLLTGILLTTDVNASIIIPAPNLGSSGTVTSIGLVVPSFLSVSNSPITTSGVITVSLNTVTPNYAFLGPVSGGNAAPTFRAIVAGDIPTLNQNTTGSAGTVATISGLITASTNITISGSGTLASPYSISAASSGGSLSVGTLDNGTANANALTIAGGFIYAQSASPNFAGVVNTISQAFAGTKSFYGGINVGGGNQYVVDLNGFLTQNTSTVQGNTSYTSDTQTITNNTVLSAANTNGGASYGAHYFSLVNSAGYNSNGQSIAAAYDSRWAGSGNLTGNLYGNQTTIQNTNTGAVSNAYGFNGQVQNASTGTIYNSSVFIGSLSNTGGGNFATGYVFRALAASNIGTQYGFYSSIAAGTNQYEFYAAGGANNYFSGAVSIGSSSQFSVTSGGYISDNAASTLGNTAYTSAGQTLTNTVTQSAGNTSSAIIDGVNISANLVTGGFNYNGSMNAANLGVSISGAGNITGTPVASNSNIQYNGTGTINSAIGNITNIANNTTGTISNAIGFVAQFSNLSSGAITSGTGYSVGPVTGVPTAYGYYANLASGTNQWNFYAAGTAQNYFAGVTKFVSQVYIPSVALTASSTVAWNMNSAPNAVLTPTSAFTLSNPTNVQSGGSGMITFIQDSTGSRVITWGSLYRFAGGTKFTLSTAAASIDECAWVCQDGVHIDMSCLAAFN